MIFTIIEKMFFVLFALIVYWAQAGTNCPSGMDPSAQCIGVNDSSSVVQVMYPAAAPVSCINVQLAAGAVGSQMFSMWYYDDNHLENIAVNGSPTPNGLTAPTAIFIPSHNAVEDGYLSNLNGNSSKFYGWFQNPQPPTPMLLPRYFEANQYLYGYPCVPNAPTSTPIPSRMNLGGDIAPIVPNSSPKPTSTPIISSPTPIPASPTPAPTPPPNQCQGLQCFPAGQRVAMADGTERNIEAVRIGDLVLSAKDATAEVTADAAKGRAKVVGIIAHEPHFLRFIHLILDSHEEMVATDNHPVWLEESGSYIAIGEIMDQWLAHDIHSAHLLSKTGDPMGVVRFYDEFHIEQVYDLTVAPVDAESSDSYGHNYFVGGVLVHNKMAGGNGIHMICP